jgi:nucleotide-binding universal stress UspA family protein
MTPSISRILVPIDFSSHSDQALRYAVSLARRLGASLELLHVVEDPFAAGAWGSEVYVPNVTELLDNMIADARRRLSDLKDVVAHEGVPISIVVLKGRPAPVILEHAAGGRFDLIVMATHGRTGLAHLFMGSVAEAVVRRAPCPVLTLRPQPPAARQAASTTAQAVA